jgi:hypothetical protein
MPPTTASCAGFLMNRQQHAVPTLQWRQWAPSKRLYARHRDVLVARGLSAVMFFAALEHISLGVESEGFPMVCQ